MRFWRKSVGLLMKVKYVKISWLLLLSLLGALPVAAQNFTKHRAEREQYARQQVLAAVKEAPVLAFSKPLIPTREVAIAVAEPLLINTYGKQHIVEERPYETYLIDGYWYISGTLPKKHTVGGTFEIILAANDGRVIRLTHYK
jgi:hypothetical protein